MGKYTRVTTPKGQASYPWLKQPDTKFNPDGLYSCNILVDKSDATKLIEAIDKVFAANADAIRQEKKKKDIKLADKPYVEMEGNKVLFKIKSKAKIGNNEVRPIVVDAKGKPIVETDIYGGSEVKVSADLIPYFVPTNGAGVSLRLVGVQVLKLQNKPMPSMDSLGFKEEAGYEHIAQETITTTNDKPTEETNEDFV